MPRLRAIVLLYLAHLRARPLPELLALLGIAAGVALLFAVQVANKSVTGSFDQLTEGIVGNASLEVAARGPQGFDQKLFHKVKRLPDVETAAPIVERRIAVKGPKGRRPLTLFGFDERLKRMGGKLVRSVAADRDVADLGLYLTEPTAEAIGVAPGGTVTVEVGERTERLPLAGVVSSDEVGSLAQSPVAVAHLGLAQEIAAMPDSITRILVAPAKGRESEARASLKRVSAGKLNVRSSDSEARLLKNAAAAENQSSALFGTISLAVGILLAYNAMLLTMTARRRTVASLHMLGASNKTIVAMLVFEALILGLVGSLLGIFFGVLLSHYIFNDVPEYLSIVFAIGNQRVIGPEIILLSIAAGTLAALAAAAQPAKDLLKLSPQEALSEKGPNAAAISSSVFRWRLLWFGIASIALFTSLALLLPEMTMVVVVVLVLGMALILPPLISHLLVFAHRLATRTSSPALRISTGELASTPIRATALAAVGAVAAFSILAITGPVHNMQRGIGQMQTDVYSGTDIWISPRMEDNQTHTQPFNPGQVVSRLRLRPEIKSVRAVRASFLDLTDKRILVIGEPRSTKFPIAPSQIISNDFELATRRLRQTGWAALTKTLADEQEVKIGDLFSLPTPSGMRQLRLAATITNYGWPPGVLLINGKDYADAWSTDQVGALMVDISEDSTPSDGKAVIRQVLGKTSPLAIQTGAESREISAALTQQGLGRFYQIADMVLVAAVMAVAAAMLGSIWQRRQRFWGLISLGMGSGQLYRTVFLETGVILFIGCLIGTFFGLLGHYFGVRWLLFSTAHPVPYTPALGLALETLVLTTVLAAVASVIPTRIVLSKRNIDTLAQE